MKNDGIEVHITLVNPVNDEKYNIKCQIPRDSIAMDLATLDKSYGPHLVKCLHDLLNHSRFKKSVEKPKLILSS
jgi:hypothetical protein